VISRRSGSVNSTAQAMQTSKEWMVRRISVGCSGSASGVFSRAASYAPRCPVATRRFLKCMLQTAIVVRHHVRPSSLTDLRAKVETVMTFLRTSKQPTTIILPGCRAAFLPITCCRTPSTKVQGTSPDSAELQNTCLFECVQIGTGAEYSIGTQVCQVDLVIDRRALEGSIHRRMGQEC
jgi:hypothetical protein